MKSHSQLLDKTVYLYYKEIESDRWFLFDRYPRRVLRMILRSKQRKSGIKVMFENLKKALKYAGFNYRVNVKTSTLPNNPIILVVGVGINALNFDFAQRKIIAGVALMTHPQEFPDLCEKYNIVKYIQHSTWVSDLYANYFGKEVCDVLWPVGIDTDYWSPIEKTKDLDFIIYNKIKWDLNERETDLLQPIRDLIDSKGMKVEEIRYGKYKIDEYLSLLRRSKFMIFLSEHESQGIAYQEAMSVNVPVFAWDIGKILDPLYKEWGDYGSPATSVPFWDERCGLKFADFQDFETKFELFLKMNEKKCFNPREFVLENLSFEKSASALVEIFNKINF